MTETFTSTPRWARPAPIPDCPPGWSTGSPDFVGVGVQRGGTGWWFRTLRQHPRVVKLGGQPKELHYFDRFWRGEVPAGFAEDYHRHFPRPPGKVTGEWTPRYMADFWSLRLLHEAAPEARLLILLRDPVERFLSGLAKQLRKAQQRGVEPHLGALGDMLFRGMYHDQLRRVYEFFAPERVLVLQYERCREDPTGQMDATLSFLGLEPFDAPPDRLLGLRRRAAHDKPVLPDAMRADLAAHLREDVRRTAGLCPGIDLSLWPNFADLAAERGPGSPLAGAEAAAR